MSWRDSERFPRGNGEWQTLDRFNNLESGENSVRKKSSNWFPLSLTLYATPSSRRFSLAICVPEIADSTHTRFASKFRVNIGLIIFYLLLVAILSLAIDSFWKLSKIFSVLFLLLGYSVIEYNFFVKSYTRLSEHSLFFNWAIYDGNPLVKVLAGITLFFGILQLIYQLWFGDLNSLIINFGVYYPSANSGEWWRYTYGAFFHKNFIHWSINIGMLFIAAGLAGPFSNHSQIISFVAIVSLSSFAAQLALIGDKPDAFGGISGGIFGLFGWIIGHGYRKRDQLPKGYYLRILTLTFVNLLLPLVMDLRASLMAHLIGLALGLLLGLVGISEKNHTRI